MKFAIIALAAVVACSCLALAEEKKVFMPPRMGHFGNKHPFIDLYKAYATAFVYPLHPGRERDDYRNYLPTGEECMLFFRQQKNKQFELDDLPDLVLQDACLTYLFLDDNDQLFQEMDERTRASLKEVRRYDKLMSFYNGTNIEELDEPDRHCVANLLLQAIQGKDQFRTVPCNNHFFQVYLQFAKCQGVSILAQRNTDSYILALYHLLEKRVKACFDIEIDHIINALDKAYENGPISHAVHQIGRFLGSPLTKQRHEKRWPVPVSVLLTAVQGTGKEVNTREVHKIIKGVYEEERSKEWKNKKPLTEWFLRNMGKYATKKILGRRQKSEIIDPTGEKRYQQEIDKICRFFRSSTDESEYDYATPITRMVELLTHVDLFNVTAGNFIESLLTRSKRTSPIYLGVSACNLLTYTYGTIINQVAGRKPEYVVGFQPNTSLMVRWPVAEYY